MAENIIKYLEERGFVDALTSRDLEKLCERPTKVYVGFDPTSDSLHLGNLIAIIALAYFQRFGHTPVVVLGGATGMIGDPSGKSHERPLLDRKTIKKNIEGIARHFHQVLDFSGKLPMPVIIDNAQWYENFSIVDFLRDVGKHFRIGPMLAKDSVRSRLASEEGMSFTEFSYQLIQSYDFYHLFKEEGVKIQMGGSDQWGNITAGIEFTRKLTKEAVYGITWPLLTRSDGKKFGKTAEGAIWLDPHKCSPYQLYQYLFGVPDKDVIQMMKMLTFLDIEEIEESAQEMEKKGTPPNKGQKRLAEEVVQIVHGKEGLTKAQRVTEAARPGKSSTLSVDLLKESGKDMPSVSLLLSQVVGARYADLASLSGLLSSKGEGNRMVKNGGAYLNNEKLLDPSRLVEDADLLEGRFLLLGAGKKHKILIEVTR